MREVTSAAGKWVMVLAVLLFTGGAVFGQAWRAETALDLNVVPATFGSDGSVIDDPQDRRTQFLAGVAASYHAAFPLDGELTLLPAVSFGANYPEAEDQTLLGFGGVDAAVLARLVGTRGLIEPSRRYRVRAGATLSAPLPGPDFAEEAESKSAGDRYTAETVGLKAWSAGVRADGRWQMSPAWRFSADAGIEWFFPANWEASGLERYRENQIRAAAGTAYETIWYRYRAQGSIGAKYRLNPGERVVIGIGARAGGAYRPAPVVDGDIVVSDTQVFEGRLQGSVSAGFLVTGGVWLTPELSYEHILFGRNAEAQRQVRVVFSVGTIHP